MKTASPLLGRKFGPGRLKRHRDAVARRKEEGYYDSWSDKRLDPRTKVLNLTCARPTCGKQFRFVLSPRYSPDTPRYCSHLCQVKHGHLLRSKCPADYETLFDLYVTKNMTCIEIGSMFGVCDSTVRYAMMKAGVPRRKLGPRPKRQRC